MLLVGLRYTSVAPPWVGLPTQKYKWAEITFPFMLLNIQNGGGCD